MAGFGYFLAGCNRADLIDSGGNVRVETLQRFGLEHVLSDVRVSPRDLIVEQKAGGVFILPVPVHGQLPNRLQFGDHWQSREWILSEGEFRIYWQPDALPQPVDFERRRIVPGYMIQDSTGQRWLYPAMRGHDHYPEPYGGLPGEYTFTSDGTARLVLSPDYHQIWAQTARVWDHLTGAEPVGHPITQVELAQIAAAALMVNYRIGSQELATLQTLGRGVINTHNLPVILQSLCDVESIDKYLEQKKTDASLPGSDGLDSMPGSTDGSQITDLPVGSNGWQPCSID